MKSFVNSPGKMNHEDRLTELMRIFRGNPTYWFNCKKIANRTTISQSHVNQLVIELTDMGFLEKEGNNSHSRWRWAGKVEDN